MKVERESRKVERESRKGKVKVEEWMNTFDDNHDDLVVSDAGEDECSSPEDYAEQRASYRQARRSEPGGSD